MPQIVLPIFPQGCTDISRDVGFQKRDGMVCYFNGQLPVFTHAEADIASFRLFTSQLIANGHATQARIAEVSVFRWSRSSGLAKRLRSAEQQGFTNHRHRAKAGG